MLHTGHWLVDCRDTDPTRRRQRRHRRRFRRDAGRRDLRRGPFHGDERREIEAYIATGEPLQCAGSFTIDGYGGAFIRKVDGDPHTVVGLSISTLRGLLGQAQVGITELWTGGAVTPLKSELSEPIRSSL